MLTNAAGQKVQGYLFTLFGETWLTEDEPGSLTEEITRLFTGQIFDQETGLYYMNARYYDPKVGIFITADPAMDGMNHYGYASSNPIKYMDPTGLGGYMTGGVVLTILGALLYAAAIILYVLGLYIAASICTSLASAALAGGILSINYDIRNSQGLGGLPDTGGTGGIAIPVGSDSSGKKGHF